MRSLLMVCTVLLAALSVWGLKDVSSEDFGRADVTGSAQLKLEKHRTEKTLAAEEKPLDAEDACLVWGGFPVGDLVRVRLHLRRQRLEDKVIVQDRFGPERYIAYLGPYDNQTAVRAFVKQFRQQGFRTVRPILSGELSYGVEIASFKTREAAEAFLSGKKAPDMKGIKITNRLGEPTGMVDLVFSRLDADEKTRLEALRALYPRTALSACYQPETLN